MCKIVCEAMDAGAIGFASSRQPAHAGAGGKPVPSRLATMEELFALAEPLAERSRGIFAIARRARRIAAGAPASVRLKSR